MRFRQRHWIYVNLWHFDNNNNTADGARGMIETQTEPAEEHNFTGDHPKPLKRKSRHSSRSPLASPLQAHNKSKTSDKDTSGATTPLDACISNRFLKLQPSVSGSQSSFEGSSASSPSYLGLSPSLNVTPESTNSSLSSFRRLGKVTFGFDYVMYVNNKFPVLSIHHLSLKGALVHICIVFI